MYNTQPLDNKSLSYLEKFPQITGLSETSHLRLYILGFLQCLAVALNQETCHATSCRRSLLTVEGQALTVEEVENPGWFGFTRGRSTFVGGHCCVDSGRDPHKRVRPKKDFDCDGYVILSATCRPIAGLKGRFRHEKNA